MSRDTIASIEGEFRRYKTMGEGALGQIADAQLGTGEAGGNSMTSLVLHISGNLRSRFTDFLTSDGEKPWRDRESEFVRGGSSRADLQQRWEEGFAVLFSALAGLDDGHLGAQITIRGVALRVDEALHRSLAHVSYHVGQMVFLGRALCGDGWKFLAKRGTAPSGKLAGCFLRAWASRAAAASVISKSTWVVSSGP